MYFDVVVKASHLGNHRLRFHQPEVKLQVLAEGQCKAPVEDGRAAD
jgi:hypothetical protein